MKRIIIKSSLALVFICGILEGQIYRYGQTLPEKMGTFEVPDEVPQEEKPPPDILPEIEGEMTREEKAAEEPPEKSKEEESQLAAMINEYVEFGGAIEMEYFWIRDFDHSTTSDIALETAELDFEISITDWDTAVFAIEWDPEDDVVTLKEAFVTFGNLECMPYFLQTGRVFVPFGIGTGAVVGDTLTITDPLTIEGFEAREDVILVGYEWNGTHIAAYVYNGDTNHGGGNDHIEHYGGTIRYGKQYNKTAYSVGIDYISSVFDSDFLQEEFFGALEARYAPAIAFHFRYFWDGFSIVGEYNGALRSAKFEEDEEDFRLAPRAWQVQLAYETQICRKDVYFSLDYSASYNFEGTLPKRRFLANIGIWFYESILLAFEYGHDVDYEESMGGTGESADFGIIQLVYEW